MSRKRKKTVKEMLSNKLTKKQLALVPTSYDLIGDILLFSNFPDELKSKSKLIAESFLEFHKNVKVITKKIKQHSGKFRTPTLRILAGARRKETLYKESGSRILLHIEKVYFSPRLSTERMRVAKLVKAGESVLVMFSGCAPYPCVIAKNSEPKEIYAVEMNPIAHEYAEKNISLNKLSNVSIFCGDVRTVLPKIRKKFDRILMPLPWGAEDFLDLALKKAKPEAIIHFYDFVKDDEFPNCSVEKIKKACKQYKKKCKIQDSVLCGQHSPHFFRSCVDFKVF